MGLDVLTANDRPGAHPPPYYAASATPLDAFAPLGADRRADVCVIGGGYAGLAAARRLATAGLDVALLDAHRVGWGASGRNGGQVATGQRLEPDDLEAAVGSDDARRLWDVAERAKRRVVELCAHGEDGCDLRRGVVDVTEKPRRLDEFRAYADALRARYDYGGARFLDREETRAIVASEAYVGGVLDADAYHLHPLKFALGLARAAAAAGAAIFERTRAARIGEGAPIRVETDRGVVVADAVVFAANGYHGGLERRVADRVLPINNFLIATEPLGRARADALIGDRVAVSDDRYVVNYFRLSADDRLLFGGRETYRYRFPRDVKSYVRAAMVSVFPQLADVGVEYGWGGVLGITMSRMPHVERLRAGVYSLGGYSGPGVAMATGLGEIVADAVAASLAGKTAPADFLAQARAPTPPFPGGYAARLPILQLGMLYYGLRDRL
ncbi:MAG: NAD(P)/FAD-dependent oxidoreductase [Parvularculaceae bacterium]